MRIGMPLAELLQTFYALGVEINKMILIKFCWEVEGNDGTPRDDLAGALLDVLTGPSEAVDVAIIKLLPSFIGSLALQNQSILL